jgi:ABC-type sugar transport system substrate-binding protein
MNLSKYCLLAATAAFFFGCASSESKGPSSADPRGVILLRYNQGSESTEQRERGFLETMQKEFPSVTILSSDQYSGTTPEASLDKANQLIVKYGDRVEGIFAVCEPNANGVLAALEQAGMAGRVRFVGFDPNDRMVQALKENKMDGIVLQDPVKMGDVAVRTMVAFLEAGKDTAAAKIEKRISTGEDIATPQNCETPTMKRLLQPPMFQDESSPTGEKKYRIAVIPKGTTHEFWKSVHYGAEQAAKELGNVEVLWKGPHLESDRESQISLVQDFITQKVDGICLAPLDAQSLVAPVREAKEAGIPTVIFDSDLDNKDDPDLYVSYVATDNYQGGVMAARRLAEVLKAEPVPAK